MTTKTPSPTVAFIGAGNMAGAMISGLLKQGQPATNIVASDPSTDKLEQLTLQFSIQTTQDNLSAIGMASVIVLSVKPQIIAQVAQQIRESGLLQGKVFISIAAGTTVASLQQILGEGVAIVRMMPNMPALIGDGMSGWFPNTYTNEAQRAFAGFIASSCGEQLQMAHESEIDAVTALSGSGPAYFLLMIEAMVEAGQELGLSYEASLKLVSQTVQGTGRLAAHSSISPCELRQQVTSKGGTTAAALDVLNTADIKSTLSSAVKAAHQRAKELGV